MAVEHVAFSRWTCDRCGVIEEVAASSSPGGWRTIVIEGLKINRSLTDYRPQPTYCETCVKEVRAVLDMTPPEVSE